MGPELPSFWTTTVRRLPSPGMTSQLLPQRPLESPTSHGTPVSQQRESTTSSTPLTPEPNTHPTTDTNTDNTSTAMTNTTEQIVIVTRLLRRGSETPLSERGPITGAPSCEFKLVYNVSINYVCII